MNKLLLIVSVVVIGVAAGLWFARGSMPDMNPAEGEPGHKHELGKKADSQGKVYYTCAMHPQVHLDEPGNCPICGMQLIKKIESAESPAATGSDVISIDPRVVQNFGIRSVPVERGTMSQELRAAGSVMADENRIESVQARSAGWVEKLHVQAVNDPVRKGQLLAEIYSPELYSAQQEFVLAQKSGDAALTNGARQRLRLLGISEAQLAQLEKSGVAQRRVAYYAPISGIVTELGVREGAQLSPGMSLYTLVDLSAVWVIAEVPEALAPALARGATVEARVAALPGRGFAGKVDYIYPEVNPATRTVRVRAVLDNPKLELKPGMFAEVILGQGRSREALLVPSEAVIRTGTRTTVIVSEGEGRFRPVTVRLGGERDGRTEILDGLEAGQEVVSSGQFLIDSEANLRGVYNRMGSEPEAGQ